MKSLLLSLYIIFLSDEIIPNNSLIIIFINYLLFIGELNPKLFIGEEIIGLNGESANGFNLKGEIIELKNSFENFLGVFL